MKKYIIALVFTTTFFILSLSTIRDYGISWDETIHFRRGQAYLHYFLTGKTNYNDLPNPNLQGTNGEPKNISVPRRSLYQNDQHNGEYMLKNDSGHPPLNGILAALSNYVFYQRLGIMDDISSYHFFIVGVSALLVFVVTCFALETMGILPALVAGFVLSAYPLFWSESHFNIKVPVETAFFAATIWTFWTSWKNRSYKWLLVSFIFIALALGTKFNVLFLPLIVLPPIFLVRKKVNLTKSYKLILLLGPLLVGIIFIGSWPYLWQSFPDNLLNIFKYYGDIGIGFKYQPDIFYVLGFNTYPIQHIFFTTPPLTIFLTLVGIIFGWRDNKSVKAFYFLCILWFLIPIARVSLPGTVIYGGIRQIMEYIPAMALLSGLGIRQIILFIGKSKTYVNIIVGLLLMAGLFINVFSLIKLHPNENVYFNIFIGGLSGASRKNFPSWGNSFGNAYLQGINWINQHAELGAKLSLIQGTPSNAPIVYLRKDINFKNSNWDGIKRGGEYLMELIFNDTGKSYYYAWDYVDNFLIPVYELKVDGVTILKIWKNDLDHTKDQYKGREEKYTNGYEISRDGNNVIVKLRNKVRLSNIVYTYSQKMNCMPIKTAFMETSLDGKAWVREKDWVPFPQMENRDNMIGNSINYYFAGRNASYIKFVFDDTDSCGLHYGSIRVYEI